MEWSRNGKSKRSEVQLEETLNSLFSETELLYSPDYFRTCCVDQAGPKLRFTCFCLPGLEIKGMCHYIPPREFSFTSSAGLFVWDTLQMSACFSDRHHPVVINLSLYFCRHIFYVALAGFKLRSIYSAHPHTTSLSKIKGPDQLEPSLHFSLATIIALRRQV